MCSNEQKGHAKNKIACPLFFSKPAIFSQNNNLVLFCTHHMLDLNTQAPAIKAFDQNNIEHTLKEYKGRWVLLYFYPKDDTPGCTREACGLRDNYEKFQAKAVVIGVSADSVETHKKFAEKFHLPFTLLADPKKEIIRAYGAAGFTTKRVSYLIDPKGMIFKAYPKVDPSTHAEEIFKDLENLK